MSRKPFTKAPQIEMELLQLAAAIVAGWPLPRCRVALDALTLQIVQEQAPEHRQKVTSQLTALRFEKVGSRAFFVQIRAGLRFGVGCKARTWIRHFNTLAKLAAALEQRALKRS